MFCSRCGTSLDDNARHCSHCGLDLTPTTPVRGLADGSVTEQDIVTEALAQEYEVLQELGRGGMAIVFRARERHLDREVAVKVLPFSLAFDQEFVERFQREARTAAQLEHPNIIPIYRVGRAGRVTYFVMKFLRGGSLSQLLYHRERLTPPEIRRILIETGSALGYAARRGTVHRDIKPDNLMFDEFGACVVTDFGIAKAASGQRLTGTGMSIGTPHYMSPEQARAQSTDGRSDIYSLGVVAFQCLTGRVPYEGADSFSIGYKHIMEPIPVPDLASPDERRLFEVIRKMMAKDPHERFHDGEELIGALAGDAVSDAGAAARATRAAGPRVTSQPTTPLPAAEAATAPAPAIGRPTRRPVARRRQQQASFTGVWIFLIVLAAGAAGAAYWFGLRPAAAPATPAATDSLPSATAPDPPRGDTLRSASESPGGSIVGPPSAPDTGAGGLAAAAGAVAAAPAESGSVRVLNLPRGSTVLIDERPVLEPITRLSAGPHVLAISAPRHEFYTDTIRVAADSQLDLTPALTPVGAPATARRTAVRRLAQARTAAAGCAEPGPGYNAEHACYDVRPRPLGPTFVPLPPEVQGIPRPTVLLVYVSAEGQTQQVREFTPSNDLVFERVARRFARAVRWKPAEKDGKPVAGWTQWSFAPEPQ